MGLDESIPAMSLASGRRDHRHIVARGSALIALACVALLVFTARAWAAETIYWDNYSEDASISFANIDGSGGGSLNVAGGGISNPEGMAYDSVTNRLFVASHGGPPEGQISVVYLDGRGASVFSAPGAPMEEPEGVTIDPATRRIYWINDMAPTGTISWARLDGSIGGVLDTTGATVDFAYRIALDPIGRRVYWGNIFPPKESLREPRQHGGWELNITGATPPNRSAVWLSIRWPGGCTGPTIRRGPSLSRTQPEAVGTDVNIAGATIKDPFGLAFDPTLGRIYWPNSQEDVRVNTIGFADLTGGVGGITPQTAPLHSTQDPVILKSPTGTGAPTLSRNAKLARADLLERQLGGGFPRFVRLPGTELDRLPMAAQWQSDRRRHGSGVRGQIAW